MGEALSVLDIAWLIYAHRLSLAGYPLERLHPHVFAWKERLASRPEFAKEIAPFRETKEEVEERRRAQARAGKTLEAVAGF
jgi:glutathione S-transferase